MGSFLKLIAGLLIFALIVAAGGFALNRFYPEKLPMSIKNIVDKAETSSIRTMEDVIPGYATEAERELKAQLEENNRIAIEERGKLQRLGQQKAEYEFNKAFDKWYTVHEDCKNTNSPRMISLCVNQKKEAKEKFKAIWSEQNN